MGFQSELIRLKCVKCGRFVAKVTRNSLIHISVYYCDRCKHVSVYSLKDDKLRAKFFPKGFKEPEALISEEEIERLFEGADELDLNQD